MGTVGQFTMHSPPLSQVKSFKRIVEKRSLGGGGHSPEVLHWTITVEIREVAAVMNELVLQKERIMWAD